MIKMVKIVKMEHKVKLKNSVGYGSGLLSEWERVLNNYFNYKINDKSSYLKNGSGQSSMTI